MLLFYLNGIFIRQEQDPVEYKYWDIAKTVMLRVERLLKRDVRADNLQVIYHFHNNYIIIYYNITLVVLYSITIPVFKLYNYII
jgi:hypothetical protein